MAEFYPQVYDLRPWYHDFDKLGLQTRFATRRVDQLKLLLNPLRQRLGHRVVEKGERFSLRQFLRPSAPSHPINQRRKEEVILPYIERSLRLLGNEALHRTLRCLDLFCADGYYSCLLASICSTGAEIVGIDLDEREIRRAQTAAGVLGFEQIHFQVDDVLDIAARAQPYDLILCTGGLYHLTAPRELLVTLGNTRSRYLVVQSVVTVETADPHYFVSPAPGWKHGSRFTHAGLTQWILDAGWRILESTTNELAANTRPCDRGSSYFLCANTQVAP